MEALPLALLLWLPQNAVHEGMHAFAHRWAGDKVTELWPLPGWKSGSFAFAYMRYETIKGRKTWQQEALCAAAPQLWNTLVLLLLLPVHALDPDDWMTKACTAVALVNFIDGAVNLSTFYRWSSRPRTDGWRTAEALGAPVWTCRAIAATWQLGMGAHVGLLLQGLWVA